MGWTRPRYWKILETWGTDQKLPLSTEPYAYVPRLSQLVEWKTKARKHNTPYAVARYGVIEEEGEEARRVFGIFIYPKNALQENKEIKNEEYMVANILS